MRLTILAIGRARKGPEVALASDYLARLGRVGRDVALGPAALVELEARGRSAPGAESTLILSRITSAARVAVLDERGAALDSADFARTLGQWRDDGAGETVFAIGGAQGHTDALRDRADLLLGFGRMTWPHLLARAMLAEQLYRAATILSGRPYHKA